LRVNVFTESLPSNGCTRHSTYFFRRYISYHISYNCGIISIRLRRAALRLPLCYGLASLDGWKVRLFCMSSKNIRCSYCIKFHKSLECSNAFCFKCLCASLPASISGANLTKISTNNLTNRPLYHLMNILPLPYSVKVKCKM
jgi:hypothetical protein